MKGLMEAAESVPVVTSLLPVWGASPSFFPVNVEWALVDLSQSVYANPVSILSGQGTSMTSSKSVRSRARTFRSSISSVLSTQDEIV